MGLKNTCAIFIISILPFLASCNNDVFVEEVPEVEDTLYLDGYDGKQTIQIKKDVLKFISLGDYYGSAWQPSISYYSEDGEEIDYPPTIKNISKIVYVNRIFAIVLNIKDDKLEIECLDNTLSSPIETWINLDYGYLTKYVTLKIGEGQPYEITSFGHAVNRYSTKTETITGIREKFHNNTDQIIKVAVYPYKDFQSKLTLTPDDGEYWSGEASGKVCVPYFTNGGWTVDDTEEVEATINGTAYFDSCMVNQEEEAHVEVPPNSSLTITTKVTFAVMETAYNTMVHMPGTEVVWSTSGTLTLTQPISYQIEVCALEL